MARVYLALVAVTWLIGWRWSVRRCRRLGVTSMPDVLLLTAVVPAAALVLSLHLAATVALWLEAPAASLRATAWVFVALTTGLMLAFRGRTIEVARVAPPEDSVELRSRASYRGMRWPMAVVGLTYALFFIEALTRFPTGYDGLKYHLPNVGRWVHSGRLDLVVGDLYGSLPENAMTVPFLLASAGLERALSWFNIPNGLVLLGCVYALSRAVGAGPRGALAAMLVAGSVPIVLFQTFSSYVDLYGAACWMSAVLALIRASQADNPRSCRGLLVLAGLAAGLALGSKWTYLVHVAWLLPVAGWIGIRNAVRTAQPGSEEGRKATSCHGGSAHDMVSSPARRAWKPRRLSGAVGAMTVFIAAVLPCSGFWFLRGAVQAGNPLYPFGLTVAGTELLPGFNASDHVPQRPWSRKLSMWLSYPWRETNYAGTGYDYGVNNGLGAAYAMLVPAAVVFLLLCGPGMVRREPDRVWMYLFLALTLAAPLLLMTLFTEVLRYALPLVLIGVVPTARLFESLYTAYPAATRRLLTTALGVTCTIATLPPARALAGKLRDGRWDREWQYQVPGVINEWATGTRALLIGSPDLTYPFMGRDLRVDLIHENLWRARHAHGKVDGDALRRAGVEYVILRGPWPADWGAAPPGTLIFDDGNHLPLPTTPSTRIYAVAAGR